MRVLEVRDLLLILPSLESECLAESGPQTLARIEFRKPGNAAVFSVQLQLLF